MDILHLDIEIPKEGKAKLWYFEDNAYASKRNCSPQQKSIIEKPYKQIN